MVTAAEPEGADDACRSLMSGKLIPSVDPRTIADGLRTSLGNLTFKIIEEHVHSIVTVKEESIIFAMRIVWERMKLIIEPSAAVLLTAILEKGIDCRDKRIGITLSGGNIDLDSLPWTRTK